MTTIRIALKRVLMCPGCGLYPHTHGWAHRSDCTAWQTSEHQALTNIAAVFGPQLTPQSAAELHRVIETAAGHGDKKGNQPFPTPAPITARRWDP